MKNHNIKKRGYEARKVYGKIDNIGNPRTPKPTYKAGGTSPKPTAKRAQDGTKYNANGDR